MNVQKRLNEIGKKSEADRKAQYKMDEEIRKMNDAAMKSYAHDISSGADISSRAIAQAAKRAVDPMALANYDSDEDGPNVSKRAAAVNPANAVKDPSHWCEARSDNGDIYYWNVKTGESAWDKPKEGFMTIKEYEKLNEIAIEQQEEQRLREMKDSVENADEIASKYNREQLKRFKKRTEEKKPEEEPSTSYAGQYGGQPYGKWETVEAPRETAPVDYELPTQNFTYVAVTTAPSEEPPVKKFREKTITKLDDELSAIPSTFKKRKFGNRNIRKGTDDATEN